MTLPHRESLRTDKSQAQRTIARKRTRRTHESPLCEPLEQRQLLAGVTLMTHGFQWDGNYPTGAGGGSGWLEFMAAAIDSRIALDGSTNLRLQVPRDARTGAAGVVSSQGNRLDASASGEALIQVDWADASNNFDIAIADPSGRADYVADSVLQSLLASNLSSTVGVVRALAELPVQLIGHSRGGAVVAYLARLLGERGIWIEQLTMLDPHPLKSTDLNVESAEADPAPQAWANVLYADNYYQFSSNPAVFSGQAVVGAYNLYFDDLPGGYSAVFPPQGGDHADVHAWYQGTVDAANPTPYDGSIWIPTDSSWYNPQAGSGPRPAVGFASTRIAGGYNRRSIDGLANWLGGSGARVSVGTVGLQWPNVAQLRIAEGSTITIGGAATAQFFYGDRDSSSTVEFFLDNDQNPYNGSVSTTVPLGKTPDLLSTQTPKQGALSLTTAGVTAGTYWLYAKTTDGGRTRYAYAPTQVTFENATLGDALAIAPGTPDAWHDFAPGGDADGSMEVGENVTIDLRLLANKSADNIQGTLLSNNGKVTVTQPLVGYGNVGAGVMPWGYGLGARVDQTGQGVLTLHVTYSSNGIAYYQDLSFIASAAFFNPGQQSAAFTASVFSISDPITTGSSTNDGDGVFESGEEKVAVKFTLQNIGNGPATDVYATLVSTDSDNIIGVTPGQIGSFGSILPTGSGTQLYSFVLDSKKYSFAGLVPIKLHVVWAENPTGIDIVNSALQTNWRIAPAPWLSIDPLRYDFGVVAPNSSANLPGGAVITNFGSSDMQVSIPSVAGVVAPGGPWTIQAGSSQTISVNVTAPASGAFSRILAITSNGRTRDDASERQIILTGFASSVPLPTQIVGASPRKEDFDIAGRYIVWSQGDIFGYDTATGTQFTISASSTDERRPRISGSLVAWHDFGSSGSSGDIRAYDLLTKQVIAIPATVNTAADERLIGVDNGHIVFLRAYADSGAPNFYHAYNVFDYDTNTGTAPVQRSVNSGPDGSGNYTTSDDLDSGGGVIAWTVGSMRFDGSSSNTSVRFETVPSGQALPLDTASQAWDKRYFVSANYGRGAWLKRDKSQIGIWDGVDTVFITPTEPDVNDSISSLAIGTNHLVYVNQSKMYYRTISPTVGGEQVLALSSGADTVRMDGDGVAWHTANGLCFTFVGDHPDLGIVDVVPSTSSPTESAPFDVTVTIRNGAALMTTSDYDLELFDGDPAQGATLLAPKQTILAGLASQGSIINVFSVIGLTPEGRHTLFARIIAKDGYDNPYNNIFKLSIDVADSDQVGPNISGLSLTEYQGDNDGLIGSDEGIKARWHVEDIPSGIKSTSISFDGGAAMPGVDKGGGWFEAIRATPLGAGNHHATVVATDNDDSPASSSSDQAFTVWAAERLIVTLDGDPVLANDVLDLGIFLWHSGETRTFVITNIGQQRLTITSLTSVPAGWVVAAPPLSLAPNEPGVFTVSPDTSALGEAQAHLAIHSSDPVSFQFEFDVSAFVNARPSIGGITPSPNPVRQSQTLTLTATGVTDTGGTVTLARFYRDSNGNGQYDDGTDLPLTPDGTSVGGNAWTWSGAVDSAWGKGSKVFFARAQDDKQTWSAPVSSAVMITDQPPSMSNPVWSVIVAGTNTPATIDLVFSDDSGLDQSSNLDGVSITGPKGPVSVTRGTTTWGSDSKNVTVRYSLNAPGGWWGPEDKGTYHITIAAGTIKDIDDQTLPSQDLPHNVAIAPSDLASPGYGADDARQVSAVIQGGSLVVYERNAGTWTRATVSGATDLSGDVVTWTDPVSHDVQVAARTGSGQVIHFSRSATGAWTPTNLSTSFGLAALSNSELTAFVSIDKTVFLAGVKASGDLIAYQSTNGGVSWSSFNVSEQLDAQALTTPLFADRLVSYVTPWNALNIAGLDSQGHVQVVWWAPGLPLWRTDDLTTNVRLTAPATEDFQGGLTPFVTPWGGTNLGAANERGEVVALWWAPGMASWAYANISDYLVNPGDRVSLSPMTMTTYTTHWGGLNIAGIDANNNLTIYWWAPGEVEWRVTTLDVSRSNSNRSQGKLSAHAAPTGIDIGIVQRGSDGHLLRYSWLGTDWLFEDLG